jgi:uncharacterized protein YdcH (DUF465 family)
MNQGNDDNPGRRGPGMGRGMGAQDETLGIDEAELQRMQRMRGADSQRMQQHRHDQQVFHTLLERHSELHREVENLPNGIRAVTTSESPDLAELIREHAHVMHRRLQEKFGLRYWDPAFAEIFARADAVHMQIRNLPNGVETIETSDDANVVKLIQAHGEVVSAFVREGFEAARRESPLPKDYHRALR